MKREIAKLLLIAVPLVLVSKPFAFAQSAATVTEWNLPWPFGGVPQAIIADNMGNVWFDQEAGVCAIGRLNPKTNAFTFWTVFPDPSFTRGGVALEFDTNGDVRHVWFTYGPAAGNIRRLDPNANPPQLLIYSTGTFATRLAVDSSGRVYFTEQNNNSIGRITPSSNEFLRWSIPTANSFPQDVVIAPDGNVFFTEQGGNKIGKLDPTTNILTEWQVPTSLSQPFHLSIDFLGHDPMLNSTLAASD